MGARVETRSQSQILPLREVQKLAVEGLSSKTGRAIQAAIQTSSNQLAIRNMVGLPLGQASETLSSEQSLKALALVYVVWNAYYRIQQYQEQAMPEKRITDERRIMKYPAAELRGIRVDLQGE